MLDEIISPAGLVGITPAQVYKKVQWNALPLLCLVAASCYVDRTNLAFASIQLNHDLQFTPSVYGLGSGLFFLGYSLFMIPSNIIMLKVGAPKWLGMLVALWGVVAAAFCTLSTPLQFYWLRFLLGAAEAGAFPAIWYYLYTLLPPDQLTMPFSILEVSVSVANVFSAPLAAGLLQLSGSHGLAGWQWLFLVEGCSTVAIGVAAMLLLPAGVSSARYLSSAERRWLAQRLEHGAHAGGHRAPGSRAEDVPGGGVLLPGTSILGSLREAVGNYRVWYVAAMGLLKNMASHGILFWCPILVAALMDHKDFEPLKLDWPAIDRRHSGASAPIQETVAAHVAAQLPRRHAAADEALSGDVGSTPTAATTLAVLLTGLPFACAAIMALWLARRSQAKGERAMHLAAPYLLAALLFASLPRLAATSSVLAFVAMCVLVACVQGANPIINAYIPHIAGGSSVSLAMALYNAVANLGGLVGPWAIGEVVSRTGGYGDAFRLLGAVMGMAAIMAWYTRLWPRIGQAGHGRPGSSHGGADDGTDDSVTKMLEESEF